MVKTFLERHFNGLLLLVIALNATCFFPSLIEGDAMLYANISKRIAISGDWTNLYADGVDWLDKPHLPFWISAISFKFFGVSAFAYKLPAFLFWLASLYYTYRLAVIIYGTPAARYAVLIYGSALHVILSNMDVRAEPYLTAFIVAAIYFITQAYLKKNYYWFLLAAVAAAGAIMTKGLFAAITIAGGFIIYLVMNRKVNELLNYRWWLAVLLSFLFITPELYTLYAQFDKHPEKTVFGQTNVSGIKFFLWDSQFGRFFNTGPIKGKGDMLFFFHSTLWAFLPWSFFLAAAIWQGIKKHTVSKLPYIITGSALLTFLLFSVSKFQLPHYIVIILPHFALMTGNYFAGLHTEKAIRRWNISLAVLLFLLAVGLTALAFYSGLGNSFFAIIPVIGTCIAAILAFRGKDPGMLVAKGIFFSAALFWYMNIFFYPALLKYQAGPEAAKTYNALHGPAAPYMLNRYSRSFELFSYRQPIYLSSAVPDSVKLPAGATVYQSDNELALLENAGYRYGIIKGFDDFRVTMLTAGFLNEKTRREHLTRHSLIKIYAVP